MATLQIHEDEPLRKRIRLSPGADLVSATIIQGSQDVPNIPNAFPNTGSAGSSFTFTPKPHPNTSSQDYIVDIANYIPVGSLRIQRSDCAATSAAWASCSTWSAFAHPRDVYVGGGSFLDNKIQEQMFASRVLQPYRAMHNAEWIRMEFKMKDQHSGQIRVYILPDDVGRATIGRQQTSLRKAMQLLIAQIDISKATWDGKWSEDTPVAHIDASLDEKPKEDVSLFRLFNTLPSPKPNPEVVVDRYAREAMYRILDSDIEGLTTKMHQYQRRSAALMLQREAQPSQLIDPRLRPIMDQKGLTWYCDLDAGTCLREPRTYESAKGGICAETMGLGKTLICLALILATRELSSQIPVEHSVGIIPRGQNRTLMDMAAATIGRNGTPWKNHFAVMELEGYDFARCVKSIRENTGFYNLPGPMPRRVSRNPTVVPPRRIWLTTATIVVVPPNLVQQWRHEIKKHTVGLKVLVMNSNKTELPPAKELTEYDLILFSKPRFDKESKDGSDNQGRRRTTTNAVCRCPYIGSTRERDCTCFKEDEAYSSPLKELHFKRLITDEGHTFGNSSGKTDAITVVDFLQLSSRWIVSGTPTQGLYGAEVELRNSSTVSDTPVSESDEHSTKALSSRLLALPEPSDMSSEESSAEQEKLFYKQERKDLEKLGTIATTYLKARPWASTYDYNDLASWSQHVMQPRHGSKSSGNMDCLKSTLEGMIIRHRPEDVSQDVVLPPLHQNVVYLDGSMQDRLSLNMFAMMIVSNAVTSERKDNDYFFHPRQRKSLQLLVSNMRQASFFWSGFTADHVQSTIDVAKTFFKKGEVPVTPEDEVLLYEAIMIGQTFIANNISKAARRWHEMPMYIENECPEEIRAAWALDEDPRNPTLMGAGMVVTAQGSVQSQLWKENPMEGLAEAGKKALENAYLLQNPPPSSRAPKPSTPKDSKRKKVVKQDPVPLAGGVSIGNGSSLKKRPRKASTVDLTEESTTPTRPSKKLPEYPDVQGSIDKQNPTTNPKSILKKLTKHGIVGTLDPTPPLASASIISTASAKLSYLMDRIVTYHTTDKILVFYEADNIAYYIAQGLECLHIKHLIYAKSLSSDRRSKYVVTFNQSDDFRVLLMDVSQAAFGLDLSSASRVYFVNPVFSPQVEAQAVKRAHRIGQKRPVFVETLVLKGSIEEVILERRKDMSTEEHNKCKSILDDQTMYDWIRNVRFLPLPGEEIPGPEQMAKLETPQLVFGRGAMRIGEHDPDAGLVADDLSPISKSKKRKAATFADDKPSSMSINAKGKRKATFANPEPDGYISTEDAAEEVKDQEQNIEQEEYTSKAAEERMTQAVRARKRQRPSQAFVDITGSEGEQSWPPAYPEGYEDCDEGSPTTQEEPFCLPSPLEYSKNLWALEPPASPSRAGPSYLSTWDVSGSLQPANGGFAVSGFRSNLQSPYAPSQFSDTPDAEISRSSYRFNPGSFSRSSNSKSSYAGPSASSSFDQRSNTKIPHDDDEIEYLTPKPRSKRRTTQILGMKMPDGEFKLPPRNYTSASASCVSSSASPTPSFTSSETSTIDVGSPMKAERAKLSKKTLLLEIKLGSAMIKAEDIRKASAEWRAEMGISGAMLGKRGWERTEGSSTVGTTGRKVTAKTQDTKEKSVKFVDPDDEEIHDGSEPLVAGDV